VGRGEIVRVPLMMMCVGIGGNMVLGDWKSELELGGNVVT
jgi:hypothetical protein